jgi:hypothetical protein
MRIHMVVAVILAIHVAVFGQTDQSKISFSSSGSMQQVRTGDRVVQNEQAPASIQQSRMQPAPSENSHAANTVQQVPPYVIYRFFFLHLDNLDQVALQEEAKGNSGDGWRIHEQRAAQLNEEEGKILKQAAYDCNKAITELEEKERSIIIAFQSQHPNGESLTLPPPPELLSLQNERIAIISSHVDDLRVQLGPDAFKKLDDYVQSKFNNVGPSAPAPENKRPGGPQ